MELSFLQSILIILLAFFSILDSLTLNIGCQYPVIVGTFAGIIVGDMQLGLMIGATLQLMVLGVGTYGGASVPDFTTGAIIGTVFAHLSNQGTEFAIGLAVPVGLLMVQLDVLARFTNTFFLHRVDKNIGEVNVKGVKRNIVLGMFPWGLSRAIPVTIMLVFGRTVVDFIVNEMPDWLMGGLKVAGGLLPVVGIAVLLRYLPTKKFFAYLIIGFVTAAYLAMPMLGVAFVGVALALIYFKNIANKQEFVTANADTGGSDSLENEEGEYEE